MGREERVGKERRWERTWMAWHGMAVVKGGKSKYGGSRGRSLVLENGAKLGSVVV